MPTYLKYEYIFFFISISGWIRSLIRIRGKKCLILIPVFAATSGSPSISKSLVAVYTNGIFVQVSNVYSEFTINLLKSWNDLPWNLFSQRVARFLHKLCFTQHLNTNITGSIYRQWSRFGRRKLIKIVRSNLCICITS